MAKSSLHKVKSCKALCIPVQLQPACSELLGLTTKNLQHQVPQTNLVREVDINLWLLQKQLGNIKMLSSTSLE